MHGQIIDLLFCGFMQTTEFNMGIQTNRRNVFIAKLHEYWDLFTSNVIIRT